MRHILSRDASAIKAVLQKEKIDNFYHFTDIRNLPNIYKLNALCSKQKLATAGIVPFSGGDELSHQLDWHNNNWNKVSLSLTPYTPMAYHLKQKRSLCCLFVSITVATWQGVEFTDTNATRSNHRRGIGLTGLNLIKFSAIRGQTNSKDIEGWHKPVQAEVLVPEYIPLGYIEKFAFSSREDLVYAQQQCGSQPNFCEDILPFLDTWPSNTYMVGGGSNIFDDDLDLLDRPF